MWHRDQSGVLERAAAVPSVAAVALLPLLIFLLHTAHYWLPTTQKCPFTLRNLTPSNTWFLGPTWVTSQTASRSVQSFLRGSRTLPTDTDIHVRAEQQKGRPCYSICSNRSIAVKRSNKELLIPNLLLLDNSACHDSLADCEKNSTHEKPVVCLSCVVNVLRRQHGLRGSDVGVCR